MQGFWFLQPHGAIKSARLKTTLFQFRRGWMVKPG